MNQSSGVKNTIYTYFPKATSQSKLAGIQTDVLFICAPSTTATATSFGLNILPVLKTVRSIAVVWFNVAQKS